MIEFKDPKRLRALISSMGGDAARVRSRNRARVVELYSGDPPFTDAEAEQSGIETNVNFLLGTELIHQARGRFSSAFLSPREFFRVTVRDKGPLGETTSSVVTEVINDAVRENDTFLAQQGDKFTSLVLHGVGVLVWFSRDDVFPSFVPLDDILFPEKTLANLTNLPFFAVLVRHTPHSLAEKTINAKVPDPGWNIPAAKAVISSAAQESCVKATEVFGGWSTWQEETLAADLKENGGLWSSDAAATVDVWHVFHRADDGWRMLAFLDQPVPNVLDDEWLYKSPAAWGDSVRNVLAVQVANGGVTAPTRLHLVRGLGQMLYAVTHLHNRSMGQLVDSVNEAMCQIFRGVGAADVAQSRVLKLGRNVWLPQGVEAVGRNERYVADHNGPAAVLSTVRQLMQEHVSSYTADQDTGSEKSQTATEVAAKVSTANALLQGMLGQAYTGERELFREVVRRVLIEDSSCPVAQKIAAELQARGVSVDAIRASGVSVEGSRAFGGGDQFMGIAAANALMQQIGRFAEEQQREILRIWVFVVSNDADFAIRMVPLTPPSTPQPGVELAQDDAARLFVGVPGRTPEPESVPSYAVTLCRLIMDRLGTLTGDPEARPAEVEALLGAVEHVAQILARYPNPQIAKVVQQVAGEVNKAVQAVAQRDQGQPDDDSDDAGVQAGLDQVAAAQKVALDKARMEKEQASAARQQVALATDIKAAISGGAEGSAVSTDANAVRKEAMANV